MRTRIGGGVVRDLLLAQIPTVLPSDLYAVAALADASMVVLGDRLDISPVTPVIAGAMLCFTLRLAAIELASAEGAACAKAAADRDKR